MNLDVYCCIGNPGYTHFGTQIQLTTHDISPENDKLKRYAIFKASGKGLCLELKEQEFKYKDNANRTVIVKIWFNKSTNANFQGWIMKATSTQYTGEDVWITGNEYGENICLLMIKDS